jgi:acetyl-CoA synthetase
MNSESPFVDNGQFNIGYICSTLQCERGNASKTAMRWRDAQGKRADYTFADLHAESNRFANLLTALGVKRGDIIFTFLPKMPELFFSFLGILKLGAICGTLFPNFGEDALLERLGDSRAKGIITKKSHLKKLSHIRRQLSELKFIIVVDEAAHSTKDTFSLPQLMAATSTEFSVPATSADTPSVLHYTSGSTGRPKGVLHHHGSITMQSMTAREVLGLRSDDIFWCTADQGWVTGTSYGIIGPWSLGVTQVHYGGNYEARAWLSIIASEGITIWYSAPTAFRMLMREDQNLFKGVSMSSLRRIYSVGEPLNPEVIFWARRVLGHDIYDTWFQTETGAIMISNQPEFQIHPGSMGKPVYGIETSIRADNGEMLPDGQHGVLCIKSPWPSMFVTYWNNDAAYREKFSNGFYYTGDIAYRDQEGYYWFLGRNDDVVNTAGHLVSPFEVESALLEIGELAESAVIGAPDDLLFEKVVAFVRLHDHVAPGPDLELKIRLHVSKKVSTVATPQEIIFCDSIPKNKSGKIMRRVLKARYLGCDPGDTSTLEAF